MALRPFQDEESSDGMLGKLKTIRHAGRELLVKAHQNQGGGYCGWITLATLLNMYGISIPKRFRSVEEDGWMLEMCKIDPKMNLHGIGFVHLFDSCICFLCSGAFDSCICFLFHISCCVLRCWPHTALTTDHQLSTWHCAYDIKSAVIIQSGDVISSESRTSTNLSFLKTPTDSSYLLSYVCYNTLCRCDQEQTGPSCIPKSEKQHWQVPGQFHTLQCILFFFLFFCSSSSACFFLVYLISGTVYGLYMISGTVYGLSLSRNQGRQVHSAQSFWQLPGGGESHHKRGVRILRKRKEWLA